MPEFTVSTLNLILDTSSEALIVFDSEAKVLYANKFATQLFNKENIDFKGLRCGEFLNCKSRHSDEKGCGYTTDCSSCELFGAVCSICNSQVNAKEIIGEAHLQRDSNLSAIWVKYKACGIRLEGNNAAILTLNDITEFKEKEQLLNSTLAELAAIHENVPIAMMLLDQDRCVRKANGFAAKFSHRSENEMIGLRGGEAMRCLHHLDVKEGCGFGPSCSDCKVRNAVQATYETQANQADIEAWLPFDKIGSTENRCLLINTAYIRFNNSERVLICAQDITERKRHEIALQESEAKFRLVFDSSPDAIALYRLDGTHVETNSGFTRLTGFTKEDVMGKTSTEIGVWCNLADRETLVKGLAEVGYYENLEADFRRKDGSIATALMSAEILLINNEPHILSITRDITERKQSEAALRLRESYLTSIIETLPGLLWMKDAEGKFLSVNAKYSKFCGLNSPELLIGKTDRDVWPQELADRFIEEDAGVLTIGKPVVIEGSLFLQDETRWYETFKNPIFDDQGMVIGTTGYAHDITERKISERELEKSVSLLEASLESTADGVLIVDKHRKLVRWNQKYSKMWGLSEEILSGRDAVKIITQHVRGQVVDSEQFFLKISEIYEQPERSIFDEIELLDGRIFERYSQSYKIGNAYAGRVWSFRDVTDRKQAEEEREKLHDQLNQAQKMESIGRLAGGVAHDFNNMLGVILGHAEMAMDEINHDHPMFQNLEAIYTAAERSANITQQLLAFARKQVITPQMIDLNQSVEGVLKMLQRLIGEDVALLWKPGYDVWTVKIDSSQLDQILANLCINGRDAISDIGTITIETSNVVFDEEYCQRDVNFVAGDYVMLAVSDTGDGMDKATLEHIFEPFFTTKDVGEGTGLGLPTVYGAVRQNNGFVHVYSELGRGMTFKIYLPRHIDTVGQAKVEETANPVMGGHETILLVEDEPTIMDMTSAILRRLGYSVIAVGAVEEAIRIVNDFEDEIHLLITDLIMPKMNGKNLSEQLLIKRPEMHVLFMSGYTSNVIARHGILDEGVQFIQKPFSKKDLAAKVRMLLD